MKRKAIPKTRQDANQDMNVKEAGDAREKPQEEKAKMVRVIKKSRVVKKKRRTKKIKPTRQGILKKKLSKKPAKVEPKKDAATLKKDRMQDALSKKINAMIDEEGSQWQTMITNAKPEEREKVRAGLFQSLRMMLGCMEAIKRNKVLLLAILIGMIYWMFG